MDGRVLRPLPALLLAVTTVFAVASIPVSAGHELVTDTALYPVNGIVLALAGALIVSRHRRNTLGWLLCAMGVLEGFTELIEGYGYHAAWTGSIFVAWLAALCSALNVTLFGVMLALFPDARSPANRRIVSVAVAAAAIFAVGAAFGPSVLISGTTRNPYEISGPAFDIVYAAGQVLVLVALFAAIVRLAVRFKRSSGVERQQLKWVAYAVALLAVPAPFAIFYYNQSALVQVLIAFGVTAVPAAVCVAILRYRLYGIDVIINRTLVYGSLTVLLVAAYLAVTLALGAAVGDRRSPWVTAAATLTAAVAFRPLRRLVQDAVDRRFRRARYDALARVDAFLDDLRAGRAAPDSLADLLREVLDQPELEVVYPRNGAVAEPADEGLVDTGVDRAGDLLAVVRHRPVADVSLMTEVLERAGLAIEIAGLQAEVHHQLAEVKDSRARIVVAGYEERRRLERDLHDGAQQRLVSIGLELRHAQHLLGPGSGQVAGVIDSAVAEIAAAIGELRELAQGVRPALLDNGLGQALRELASRSAVPVDVQVSGERFAVEVEATAYFVACEAITNAVKHAQAASVVVRAERSDGHLVILVRDDGVGGARLSSNAAGGSGLRGLSDRIAAHGGRIRLDSPLGRGTTLVAELPCAS